METSGAVRLSGTIMAHPRRRHWAEDLSSTTGLPITWDQTSNVWDTARRAWSTADPDATHHLVLQDDAVLCARFMPSAARFVAHLKANEPASLIVLDYRLHSDRLDYQSHIATGKRIWRSWNSVSAIALILPTADIAPMLAFGDEFDRVYHDDFKIREFYKQKRRLKFAFPIPSLVQHRDQHDSPSLLTGHDDKHPDRTSHQFIGEDTDALSIDWHAEAEAPMSSKVIFQHRRSGDRAVVDASSKSAQYLERHPHWLRIGAAAIQQEEPTKPAAPAAIERPRNGANATRAEWLAYAHAIGVDVTSDDTKKTIIEACDAAAVQ